MVKAGGDIQDERRGRYEETKGERAREAGTGGERSRKRHLENNSYNQLEKVDLPQKIVRRSGEDWLLLQLLYGQLNEC